MVKKSRPVMAISAVVCFAFILAALVQAQMTPIYRFRGVNLPLKLKVEDKVINRGTYDVEFLRTSSPVLFYMRILKRGKILALVQGEEWPYSSGIVSDIPKDDSIPKKPALKMSINRDEKLLNFTFESGLHALKYPMVRARFKLPYEE